MSSTLDSAPIQLQELLLRFQGKQANSDPSTGDLTSGTSFFNQTIQNLSTPEASECPLCLDCVRDAVLLPCMHFFCRPCIGEVFDVLDHKEARQCPVCRMTVEEESIVRVIYDESNATKEIDPVVVPLSTPDPLQSTKLRTLLEYIQSLNKEVKCVVYSQFIGMLDLIEQGFKKYGILFTRIDGKLSRNQRDAALLQFREDPSIQILIASLMTANVGLNLTCARVCVLMDPWWYEAYFVYIHLICFELTGNDWSETVRYQWNDAGFSCAIYVDSPLIINVFSYLVSVGITLWKSKPLTASID
jgi:hypothetical protein